MANCWGCPYRWNDDDCEYCGARNDEIIDDRPYSKETCGYYQEYRKSRGLSEPVPQTAAKREPATSGGLALLCGIIALVAGSIFVNKNTIIAGIIFLIGSALSIFLSVFGIRKKDGMIKGVLGLIVGALDLVGGVVFLFF